MPVSVDAIDPITKDGTLTGTGEPGNALGVADAGISTAKLADGAVTTAKLATTGITPGSYTNVDVTVTADGRITAIANGSGGGGSISRAVDTPAAIGAASFKAVRLGGAALTFGGSATAGYDITIPADTEVLRIDFYGDSTTANSSGELVIRIDNSANSYDREFLAGLEDGTNQQDIDEHLTGNVAKSENAGNVTTITIPNIQGNYPNGFTLFLR